MTHSVTLMRPKTMPPVATMKYSHVAMIDMQPGQRLVHLAGQLGVTADGALLETPEDQARQIWDNIAAGLAAAGLTLSSIMHVRQYVAQGSAAAPLSDARKASLGDWEPPTTLIYVAALARPQYLYEVDIVACGTPAA